MHLPQSMQNLSMIWAFPLCTRIAWVGQCLIQLIQPRQADSLSLTERMNLYVFMEM